MKEREVVKAQKKVIGAVVLGGLAAITSVLVATVGKEARLLVLLLWFLVAEIVSTGLVAAAGYWAYRRFRTVPRGVNQADIVKATSYLTAIFVVSGLALIPLGLSFATVRGDLSPSVLVVGTMGVGIGIALWYWAYRRVLTKWEAVNDDGVVTAWKVTGVIMVAGALAFVAAGLAFIGEELRPFALRFGLICGGVGGIGGATASYLVYRRVARQSQQE